MNIKYSDVGFFYYLQTSSIKGGEETVTLLWSVLLCVKSNITIALSAKTQGDGNETCGGHL